MSPSPVPIAQLCLHRHPKTQDKSLRAWSAADELLLEYVRDEIVAPPQNCLIINDQFGALSVALNQISPLYWSDSYLSMRAIELNLQLNFKSSVKATPLSLQYQYGKDDGITCQTINSHRFDLVLIRIPKHNSLLEFQLNQIKSWITPHTKVIASGMCKQVHKSNLKIFEKVLGKTKTSLAKKKARLIFSQLDDARLDNSQVPLSTFKRYHLAQYQLNICSLAGVFSRDKLDIGTQVLLKYLPQVFAHEKVIDLGCGNGVIGAIIAKNQPHCQVLLSDESQLAIASAQLTFAENQLNNARFVQTDVLKGITLNAFEHILCNPPFHQQNVQTLAIAEAMFRQSAACLKLNGQLRVVANRHLKYQPLLKRYFAKVNSISKDNKFTVWLASSPKH